MRRWPTCVEWLARAGIADQATPQRHNARPYPERASSMAGFGVRSRAGGARPPCVRRKPCPSATTTGSPISAAAPPTSRRWSISPASALSPTRSSTPGFRALPRICADRLGIKRGDRVAVLALNTTDTLEVQFACGRIGAVFLPLNTRLTVPELHYIVGDAAPVLMIHDSGTGRGQRLTSPNFATLPRRCSSAPAALTRRRSRPLRRSKPPKSSRSMTSRPSCTPRAPRASPRAPSSPTA